MPQLSWFTKKGCESGINRKIIWLQIYRILGRTVVTYPKMLDEADFYMALDMSLNIDEIKVNKRLRVAHALAGVWFSVNFMNSNIVLIHSPVKLGVNSQQLELEGKAHSVSVVERENPSVGNEMFLLHYLDFEETWEL